MRSILVLGAAAASVPAAIVIVANSGRPIMAIAALVVGAVAALLVRSIVEGDGLASRQPEASVVAEPPRLLEGAVLPEDWPAGPWFDRRDGSVTLGFTVDRHGMPRDVRIVRSSGVAELDERSRDIVASRFRFIPARGAGGSPVEAPFEHVITWSLSSLDGSDVPALVAAPMLPQAT